MKSQSLELQPNSAVAENFRDWQSVPGWFTPEDAEAYRRIVDGLPAGSSILEVGSWLGRSLCALSSHARAAGKKFKLHAVDTFKGTPGEDGYSEALALNGGSVREAFEANLREYGFCESLTVHEARSAQVAYEVIPQGSLDAVFLDGDHSLDAVQTDITAWRDCIRSGGFIGGHDADYPEVMQAVREFFTPDQIQIIGRCWLVKLF